MKTNFNEAIARLRTLKPGETFVYYTGNLSRGIKLSRYGNAEKNAENRTIRELGDAAYAQYEMGCVYLLQRRVAKDKFDYLAVAKK